MLSADQSYAACSRSGCLVIIVYLAHPLGTGPERTSNQAKAKDWLKWAIENFPNHGFVADWILWSEVLPESPVNRAAGLAFDCELIKRCDELWLCGDHISEGMQSEWDAAIAAGKYILDLTHLPKGTWTFAGSSETLELEKRSARES